MKPTLDASETASGPSHSLDIRFIGNMAFRITDGATTLLTDFPYRSGAFGFMKYRMEDVKPIKDGLSLISHRHSDHWSRRRFRKLNHTIIAPPKILNKLRGCKTIPFEPRMTYKDIVVHAFETPHQWCPQHYSYLIEWHGLRIYFPGDAETTEHLLAVKDLDVLIITPLLIRNLRRQSQTPDAKLLILAHHRQTQQVPPFQNCRPMQQGETLTTPFTS